MLVIVVVVLVSRPKVKVVAGSGSFSMPSLGCEGGRGSSTSGFIVDRVY